MMRGYNISLLTLRDARSGKVKAYLKTAYQTQESQERSFGTDEWRGLRYMATMGFEGMDKIYPQERKYKKGDENYQGVIINPPELRTLSQLKSFVRGARESLGLDKTVAPEVMREPELREEVKKIQESANSELADVLENHSTPAAGSLKIVDEKMRGKGLDHCLHIFSARKLAEKGLALRGEHNGTNEDQESWRFMAADKRSSISVSNWVYKHRGRISLVPTYVMDFTAKS